MSVALRVLHLSHAGLPDERVERAAWSSRLKGDDVHFAGPKFPELSLPQDPFLTKREIRFDLCSNLGGPASTRRLNREFKRITAEVKPDVIHAHDLFAARLPVKSGEHFVYDDHEYWSREVMAYAGPADLTAMYKKLLWEHWEDEVLGKASAVITVSDAIAVEHRRKSSNVFVVPNFPRKMEIQDTQLPDLAGREFTSAYVGVCTPPFVRFRNADGLTDMFKRRTVGRLKVIGDPKLRTNPPILSTGRVPHMTMMRELSESHVGLIPWRKHWFHRYCNVNKAYEYAHAGCLVVMTSSLEQVRRTIPSHCLTFEDFDGLASVLSDLSSRSDEIAARRGDIQAFAKEHLLWDRFDTVVHEAYKK